MDRLRELQQAYEAIGVLHTFWSHYLDTIPLDRFRDDFYLKQKTTRVTYDYVRGLDHVDGWIDKLGEDEAFGARPSEFDGKMISRDLLDSILELKFARETIGPSLEHARILDIGAGYGRLAYRITQLWPEALVYCTDAVAVSTRVCELYLAYRQVARAEVVPLHQLDRIPRDIDVAMNVHSWSECPLSAIRPWLDLVVDRGAKYLFIVPHRGARVGHLASNDGPSSHNYWPEIEKRGYKCIRHQPKYPAGVDGAEATDYFMFERSA